MRLEQLEYLIEIAKQNSMSAASDQLHLAPQTLSISMKNLEKEMGFPIFERTSRGAILTENGKLVLQFALKTVTEYYNIVAQCSPKPLASTQSNLKGTLNICTNPSFSLSLLPYYTRIFLNRYPNVKVSISSGTVSDICNQIQQISLEKSNKSVLGIANMPCFQNTILTESIPHNHRVFLKPFSVSHYVCCVSQTSPLAKHQVLSLKTLLKHPLVLYCASDASGIPSTPLVYLLQQYRKHLNIALKVPSIPFWAQAVCDNIGVGFINTMILDGIVLDESPYLKEYTDKLVFIKTKEPLISVNSFLYHSEPDSLMTAFMDLWPTYHPGKNDPEFKSPYIISSELQDSAGS